MKKQFSLLGLVFFLMVTWFSSPTWAAAQNSVQVFMAGDSTMAIKDVKDYPETGWGVPFSIFFDDSVAVYNLAKNGRSTRTFISEGRWKSIVDRLHSGDFVIVQFGHNDESKSKTDRYTTPVQFQTNLKKFIDETRAKEAAPILMTPITRRYFDKRGKLKHTHPVYADLVREVARKEDVTFIDMEKITREYFQAMGDSGSAIRFMHLPPDTHPNYPVGVTDNTHLNELGAREVAQLVLKELKRLQHPLAGKLRVPDSKHLKLGAAKIHY